MDKLPTFDKKFRIIRGTDGMLTLIYLLAMTAATSNAAMQSVSLLAVTRVTNTPAPTVFVT